ATLGAVALAAKTLQSTTSYSRQLLAQSVIDVEQMVRDDLTAIHALAWDKAVLHGSGGNQPTGIYNLAGVNAVDIAGVPAWGKIIDMITEVATDNAILGSLGWATTPGLAGVLMQTLIATAAGSAMKLKYRSKRRGYWRSAALSNYPHRRKCRRVRPIAKASPRESQSVMRLLFGNRARCFSG